jgi:hypothetical protein
MTVDMTFSRYWKQLTPKPGRVWFYRPTFYWHGWSTLIPAHRGHDEFARLTFMLGWPFTGRMVIATNDCGNPECHAQTLRDAQDM